ncbi:MAG: RNA-directed DNA polymerase, partial [Chryseobacterium sp.]
ASKLLRSILEKISTKDIGLPQNSDASSLLASFYLNQVDIFMQHNVQAYYRFMDDIRIFCADKYEARRILKIFEFELRRCHLSVNSQKTEMYSLIEDMDVEIKAGQKRRSDFEQLFDLELNKIAALRRSDNYVYRNEAFHSSVKIIRQSLDDEDLNSSEDSSRRLNFSLNTLAMLGKNDLNLLAWEHNFKECLEVAVESLKDKPWITPQVCKVLNLVPSDLICEEYLNHLKPIVLNDKYNTYSFQAYQIWLLLAKHKCSAMDLKTYAVNQIERNDETNRPAIAAMVIYMCSVDQGYRRVVLRKFSENFTRGYFQNRLALISIRNFPAELIDVSKISSQLKSSHEFTHRHKDKDLVYVYGFDESGDENDEEFEQLYSI